MKKIHKSNNNNNSVDNKFLFKSFIKKSYELNNPMFKTNLTIQSYINKKLNKYKNNINNNTSINLKKSSSDLINIKNNNYDFNYSNYNDNSISKISNNILYNNSNKLKIRKKSNNNDKTKINLKNSSGINSNNNNNLRNSCIDFKYIFNIEEKKLEKIKEENIVLKNKLIESQTTIKNLQNIIQNLIIKDNNYDIKNNINNNEIKKYIPQPTPYVNIISYNDNINNDNNNNNNFFYDNNININNKSNKLKEKNKKRIKIKKYCKSYSKDNLFFSK